MPGVKPAILDRLRGVQRAGTGWLAFCPAHEDRQKRSLSVSIGDDGRTLVNCFASKCTAEAIARAVDMPMAALAAANGTPQNGHERRREIASYDYRDERGALLFQNVRYGPTKDFRMRRPDGNGGWTWNLADVRRVVYHLDELAEQRRVHLCEGEKDVDRLRALGLPATTTAGGAQSWRDEYAQQIRDAGIEEVIALPDNDEPGLAYVQRAAAALVRLGIAVRIVALPGLAPKGDVSDWLDAGHILDELRALSDTAPLFAPDARSERPVAPAAEPELRREGLDLALVWPDGTRLTLTAIRDGRDGVRGELTVHQGTRRLSWGSFSLASTQTRETLRKKLEREAPETPWGAYLEETAFRLTQAAREGEPIVTLTGKATSPTRELLPRFLFEGEPTLIFADGDTGKSLVALTIAVAVHSGTALPFGLKPLHAVPAAYLDWETSRDTIETRLALIAAGLGIDPPAIFYKHMSRPLVDEAAALAADFARRRIGFVVIDSKMFAVAGGDGAAFHEPITSFYNSLRLFAPAATLVLNHVTNDAARNGGPARPFGGAFAFNGPRLIWEAKRDQDVEDATAIVFTCRKANNLPRKPEPFGLRFQPGDGTITVYPMDLADASPQTVAGASLPYRLRLALASNGEMTTPEIAQALGVADNAVRTTLGRLKVKGAVVERETVAGKPTRWALAGSKR
jgi:hypothetical protein